MFSYTWDGYELEIKGPGVTVCLEDEEAGEILSELEEAENMARFNTSCSTPRACALCSVLVMNSGALPLPVLVVLAIVGLIVLAKKKGEL